MIPFTLFDAGWALEWFFLCYFAASNGAYLVLNGMALITIGRFKRGADLPGLVPEHPDMEPPISIIVPAFNEEQILEATVKSLLRLDYPEFEIMVVNDGSQDDTLQTLIRAFDLYVFPEVYHRRLESKPLNAIYHSHKHPNLRVVDKENGGKADSLNTGINCARYPFFCGVDADSILQRDSLVRVAQPFMSDRRTVASGGAIWIANGCTVRQGVIEEVGIPRRLIPLIQIVEYMRSFLFGRLGWGALNAVLIVSGAFGLSRRDTVIEAGGYRTDTVGEDMELIVRLHRHLRRKREPYRIVFLPDSFCWTEAPEDLKTLKVQRERWQRGLLESLFKNMRLFFSIRGGAPGWLAFPFFVLFEAFGPLIEACAYAYLAVAAATNQMSWEYLLGFLTVTVGLGFIVSLFGILMEELTFHTYKQVSCLFYLPAAALIENLGYRQLNTVFRLLGFYKWAVGKSAEWGKMRRDASWNVG